VCTHRRVVTLFLFYLDFAALQNERGVRVGDVLGLNQHTSKREESMEIVKVSSKAKEAEYRRK